MPEGSAVSHISTRAYRALSTYRFVVPSRDGSRYLEAHYESFSPDGRFIAFRMSTGTSDLVSTCDLRYVQFLPGSRSSPQARELVGLKDSTGKVHPYGLGCELMAWLP